MNKRYFNIVLILLALSLFLGATVQYSEGSNLFGILLFIVGILLLSKIKTQRIHKIKPGYVKINTLAGIALITFDVAYNLLGFGRGGINTLDTMIILLGISLIARNSSKEELSQLGNFGTFVSASFIILFLTFYVALSRQLYKFDHYFVMLPSAYLVKAFGFPIEIVGTETLRVGGVDDLIVKIGGPCSGLYSMFLLIGIVLGFSSTEGITNWRKIVGFTGLAALVAYGGNLFRVSVIYIVGYLYGGEAMMTVHVHLGWILFALISLTMLYILDRTRRIFIGNS
jgi:archaeosortase C (PEF-CTERM variant)